jgi:hypothetical protein
MNFDHRDVQHQNHQDGSNGANAVITDDEDCATSRNGHVAMNDDIAD